MEDLWAFNEEKVARAIFDCRTPVISAVGHETDTTIIDYVADMRAPTPSAAAELAVCDYEQLMERIRAVRDTLTFRMQDKLGKEKHQLESYQMQLRYLSPVNQIQEKRTHLMNLEEQLEYAMKQSLSSNKHRLAIYIEQLRGLSPLDKLSQGYAFVENRQGQVIHDIRQVKQEDELQIYLQNGRISAKALEIEEIDYGIERNEP